MGQAVETQIDINASAETVWALIDDSTNWDRWSEIFVGLDGPRHVGGRMKLRLRLGGLPPTPAPPPPRGWRHSR